LTDVTELTRMRLEFMRHIMLYAADVLPEWKDDGGRRGGVPGGGKSGDKRVL